MTRDLVALAQGRDAIAMPRRIGDMSFSILVKGMESC